MHTSLTRFKVSKTDRYRLQLGFPRERAMGSLSRGERCARTRDGSPEESMGRTRRLLSKGRLRGEKALSGMGRTP